MFRHRLLGTTSSDGTADYKSVAASAIFLG